MKIDREEGQITLRRGRLLYIVMLIVLATILILLGFGLPDLLAGNAVIGSRHSSVTGSIYFYPLACLQLAWIIFCLFILLQAWIWCLRRLFQPLKIVLMPDGILDNTQRNSLFRLRKTFIPWSDVLEIQDSFKCNIILKITPTVSDKTYEIYEFHLRNIGLKVGQRKEFEEIRRLFVSYWQQGTRAE